jgi:hypothetical protein
VSVARYSTLVAAFLAASLGLLLLALRERLDGAARWAVLLGAGLAAANTCAAYFLARWSAGRSNQAFMGAVLGGMVGRMAVMLAGFAVAVLAIGLPQLPLVLSLLGYFTLFLAFELAILSRRPREAR